MAILITGGGGYIGRWLAHELLAKDIGVVAFDLRGPVPGAVTDPACECRLRRRRHHRPASFVELAKSQEFSAIVHLAGIVTMGCERDPDLAMAGSISAARITCSKPPGRPGGNPPSGLRQHHLSLRPQRDPADDRNHDAGRAAYLVRSE